MRPVFLIALIASLIGSSCQQPTDLQATAPIFFEAVPEKISGVDFENRLTSKDSLNIIEYLYYYNGGGVAIGDIDNDGLEDIYLTGNEVPDKLYRNLGNFQFEDITEKAGIKTDTTWSTGVTLADINNDGYLDIYVSQVGNYKNLKSHNRLYINNKNATFTEISEAVGLDFSGFSTQAAFFDYDRDGDLDLYLMNHSVHSTRSYGNAGKRKEKDVLAGDRFYENKMETGSLLFEDVTEQVGIYSSPLGYGLALVVADIDQDGWMDVYVGNDFHENDYIYLNQGDKTFKEVGERLLDHSSRFTMGADIGDMDQDGRPDIFTLDMMPFLKDVFLKSGGEDSDKVSQIKETFGFGPQYARNHFQWNRGHASFSDIALLTETHATDWSWSVLLEDWDNDGLQDIFITNGIYKRPNDLDYIKYLSTTDFSQYGKSGSYALEQQLIETMPSLKLPNIIFHNQGHFKYQRYMEESGFTPSYSNGAAVADLNNDGHLDLVVNTLNEKALILENKSPAPGNWIGLALQGSPEHPVTIGTQVTVYSGGKGRYKELIVTRGFQSSSSPKLHFGLGRETKVDSLRILWPDGKTQRVLAPTPNQYHTIARNNTAVASAIAPPFEEPAFTVTEFPYAHVENTYFDYELEPLMPEKLSEEGPALVLADFNADGLEDFFIGGAKYQAASLFLQQQDGTYATHPVPVFELDKDFEDVDAVAVDLDRDGHLDLYVLSGGNDLPEGDALLEDRVYINNGKGNFERLGIALPRTNGGSVSVGDIDNDGLPDLFIGSRSIPGKYGLSPQSFLLKNIGNTNFEVVSLGPLGMVTDSQWADLDHDGFLDLIVVGDWMPITVYINTGQGNFTDRTREYGLKNTTGMWNTILLTDIDGNGHLDILAGNAGLNIKWKASPARPVKLFIDDYDGNRQSDPIIFYDFFGHSVPFASKDPLMRQLPYLQKKFLTYNSFSKIRNIEDLTGKKEDDIQEIKQIAELRSMMYLNKGNEFIPLPLPQEAQLSSIEGFYMDGDLEQPALFFVGNYFGYTNELGQSMAHAGGRLTHFKDAAFTVHTSLGLPKGISARKIEKIGAGKYLVITNNGQAQLLRSKSQ